MDERYRWDDHTLDAINVTGVDWRDLLHVLRAHPRVRQHVGTALRIAAPARDGHWLAVSCVEETDDSYLIVGVRWLDEEETEAVRKMLNRGS